MTKLFRANQKKLRNRYNLRIFLLNIISVSVLGTMVVLAQMAKENFQPISYYYGLILVLTAAVGYSFVTVWIGSLIMTRRLEGHSEHTYVQLLNRHLVVSNYKQTVRMDGEPVVYKKLWVIRLSEIEDIYYYKRNVIVVAPARMLEQRAEWLTYTHNRSGVRFDNWWYDSNGGKVTGGVEIPDMFLNPRRVARSIENASGKMQQKDAERREYRERMLEIARLKQ